MPDCEIIRCGSHGGNGQSRRGRKPPSKKRKVGEVEAGGGGAAAVSKAEAGGEGEEEGPSPQLSAATQPAEAMDVVAQAPAVDDGESSVTTLAPSREPSYASTSSQPPQPSKRCRNMNVQLREQVPLLVGPSSIAGAGWGTFAPRAIESGTFLVEYRGELISQSEAEWRGKIYDAKASSYLFDLNDVQVVDAARKGNRSRFINHSRQASASTKILSTRGDQHIGIFARRNLAQGEEIFFDYGPKYTEDALGDSLAKKGTSSRGKANERPSSSADAS